MSGGKPADPAGGPVCPAPIGDRSTVMLAHGGGGRMTQDLIEKLFLPEFRNPVLESLHDGALLEVEGGRIAFTTDSFVVHPLFFPGGNIGSLAVHGTVNDIAMCGARPLALSTGLILEEGLPIDDLRTITRSMKEAAEEAGVPIVTGDTKVVDHGKGDGAFINTSGIGVIPPGVDISPLRAAVGDRVIASGSLAVHGITILSVREGLEFETAMESDSAPLNGMVDEILQEAGSDVHVLRDPTRGGVASTLNEIAAQAGVGVLLDEASLPLREEVAGACEILGLDPLYVANEGVCIAIVSRDAAERVLEKMRGHRYGKDAAVIGEIVGEHSGKVYMRSRIGGMRQVDMLSGEQLPRIC